jgi:aminoglycoside phosphotransferase (APT) family kinase protein
LTGGVTHETLLVELDDVPIAVLRLSPQTSQIQPGLSINEEADALSEIDTEGVPRPVILVSDSDGSVLGRPGLLMRYVPGVTPVSWEQLRADGGDACAEQALTILANLHRVAPPTPATSSGLDGSSHARLDAVRRLTQLSGDGVPENLLGVLEALEKSPPVPTARTWVHGDFRPANLVVRDENIVGVLDWEMLGPGDPARDLGIATMSNWGKWFGDEELLARYFDATGVRVTYESLRWWRCLGFAMVTAFLAARRASVWGGGPSPELFLPGLLQAQYDWEATR